jgi:hypothetical protein
VAVTKNDLQLAVHHDPGHLTKPCIVGVEVAPGKLQILDRYETRIAADRVFTKLLPTFRKHIPLKSPLRINSPPKHRGGPGPGHPAGPFSWVYNGNGGARMARQCRTTESLMLDRGKDGRFIKGRAKTGGRVRGVPNKRTVAEQTILRAGEFAMLEIRKAIAAKRIHKAIALIDAVSHLALRQDEREHARHSRRK